MSAKRSKEARPPKRIDGVHSHTVRRRYRASNQFLEPIDSEVKRRPFCVFDIESKQAESALAGFERPFLVGFYDPVENKYEEYRNEPHLSYRHWSRRHCDPGGCIDKLLHRCLSAQYKGYAFYAHNGGGFDHLFLLTWLREHRDEYDFEVVPVQSSIQVIRVWRRPDSPEEKVTERWEFLDSMKLMPMSLDKAATAFGVANKKQHDLHLPEEDPSWSEYLEQDCRTLAGVLIKLHDLVEITLGGEVGMTTPSTSMRLFRRMHMGRNGVPERIARYAHWKDCPGEANETCGGCAHAWVRRGYYGGRTELFETHGTRIHYYDINSSYVAAMTEDMPIGDRTVEEYPEAGHPDARSSYDHRFHETGRFGGFVECTVYIPPDCPIPPLPHPHAKTNKLQFPTGTFHGVWTTEELALLKDPVVNGRILYVRRIVWFRKKPMFGSMVTELWRLRDKKLPGFDEGLSMLAKLLGNALYGKFGMKHERTSVVFEREPVEGECLLCPEEVDELPEGATQGICDDCLGSKPASPEADTDVWYQQKRVDAPYIIPHVAAWITALARVRLWRYMKAVVMGHGPDCADATCGGCGKLKYTDSVTGDRTTVVMTSSGICMMTLEELWAAGGEKTKRKDGKEVSSAPSNVEGVLASSPETGVGWFPLTGIVRHASGKTTFRLSTKHGQTQVTADHGIVVSPDGTTEGPEGFVEKNLSFVRVTVPEAKSSTQVDLFEHVAHFRLERRLSNPERVEVLRFEADADWVYLPDSVWDKQREREVGRFRRFYDAGSMELAALLRLVGAYVCDGSSSLVGVTTKSRYMFSLCKANEKLQTQLRDDLVLLSDGVTVTGPLWTETVFVVRSGTKLMSCLFSALCGHGSKGKRMPSFVFSLSGKDRGVVVQALEDGDGSIDSAGQLCFTTTSQKLAAAVTYLFCQSGLEHGFSFRPDKCAWSIRTRPVGSERKRYSIRSEQFEPKDGEYVYDLCVEGAHTFVDGVGQVLLHNTDSILTDVVLPSSSELGALKDEYPGEELTYEGVQAKVYMIERTSHNDAVRRARELLRLAMTFDGANASGESFTILSGEREHEAKVTMKGFPKEWNDGRVKIPIRTKDNMERLKRKEVLTWKRLERVRSLARTGFKRGPVLAEVSKSFQSRYDKRVLLEDGTTRAVVLDEPIGGYAVDAPTAVAAAPARAGDGSPVAEEDRDAAF